MIIQFIAKVEYKSPYLLLYSVAFRTLLLSTLNTQSVGSQNQAPTKRSYQYNLIVEAN